MGLMGKNQITQVSHQPLRHSDPVTPSVTYSFGVGSVKANELTDARGIVAWGIVFRVSVKSKKVAFKKEKGGETIILETFWSLFFLFVQGCFAVICESRWSEGSSWVGIPKQIQWKRIAWPLPKGGNVT